MLIFYDFLQLTAVMVQMAGKFFIEANMRRKAERRVYFTSGDMSHYQLSVQTYQRRLTELRRLVANATLEHFSVG